MINLGYALEVSAFAWIQNSCGRQYVNVDELVVSDLT